MLEFASGSTMSLINNGVSGEDTSNAGMSALNSSRLSSCGYIVVVDRQPLYKWAEPRRSRLLGKIFCPSSVL